jgi:hypothetical protein
MMVLGNSVLGEWCNIGTAHSNLKNNYEEVKLWSYETESFAKTGLQFCGLMMEITVSVELIPCSIQELSWVSANIWVWIHVFCTQFFLGGASGFTTYILKKHLKRQD